MNGSVAERGISRYRREVDSAMSRVCGITYSDLVTMAPAMDRDGTLLEVGAARQVAPDKFAEIFRRIHSLSSAERVGGAFAERFNQNKAAIISFGGNPPRSLRERRDGAWQPEWKVGNDGLAYASLPDGRAMKLSVANKGDNWGFSISMSDVPVLLQTDPSDNLRRLAVPGTVPFGTRLAAHIDIGEAVQGAVQALGPLPTPGAPPAVELPSRRYA